jgi:hypothetical protein
MYAHIYNLQDERADITDKSNITNMIQENNNNSNNNENDNIHDNVLFSSGTSDASTPAAISNIIFQEKRRQELFSLLSRQRHNLSSNSSDSSSSISSKNSLISTNISNYQHSPSLNSMEEKMTMSATSKGNENNNNEHAMGGGNRDVICFVDVILPLNKNYTVVIR